MVYIAERQRSDDGRVTGIVSSSLVSRDLNSFIGASPSEIWPLTMVFTVVRRLQTLTICLDRNAIASSSKPSAEDFMCQWP